MGRALSYWEKLGRAVEKANPTTPEQIQWAQLVHDSMEPEYRQTFYGAQQLEDRFLKLLSKEQIDAWCDVPLHGGLQALLNSLSPEQAEAHRLYCLLADQLDVGAGGEKL